MSQEDATPNRFKQLRQQASLTQAQLAAKLGLSRAAISQFEVGDSKPSLRTLLKLAEVLGVSMTDLVSSTYPELDKKYNSASARVLDRTSMSIAIYLPFIATQDRAYFLNSGTTTSALEGLGTLPLLLASEKDTLHYLKSLVIEVAEERMEPLLHPSDKVIAWPVPEAEWAQIYNQVCVVAYEQTVTIKAIRENELLTRGLLTLYALNPAAGFLSIQQDQIKGIWRVEEFFERPKIRL